MKYFILIVAAFLISTTPLSSQNLPHFPKVTAAGKGIVNTKVDNMAYWKRMVQLGFVKAEPYTPVKKAIQTSSIISADGLLTQDSPDVPVTTLSNTTQSENSIFVSPNDEDEVLNSNNSTDWSGGGVTVLYGCDGLYSYDAGLTWGGAVTGAGGTNGGDPTTAIGLNGRYYVGKISNDWGQSIAYSTNQGQTWINVVVAPGPGGSDLLDKNHLWIDNKVNSPYEGRLYDAWTAFVTGSPNENNIVLTRSVNQGVNWSAPVNISAAVNAGSHNQGVNLNTGPSGEVYAVWAIYDTWPSDEHAIGFAKSIDGGGVFAPATRIINNIKGIRTTGTAKDMRVNSFPSMTADISGGPHNGYIYVVWANIGFPGVNTGTDIDIYMLRSTDGGTTWSTPIRVNQDPSGLGKQHFFPWITCDPENGNLCVVYYDDRNVSATQCQTWVSYSYDGGTTWTDMKVSDVTFTPAPIGGLAASYFGDYLGITSRNMKVYPIWTDNRSGRAMTYVSPFNLNPAPGQPYVVYDSCALSLMNGQPVTTMNYGDSLHLSVGLKNIGDKPAANVTAYISSTSPFVTVTDSTEVYGSFAPGEKKTIHNGYAIKVSDSIPDGLKVRLNVRSVNNDTTWYSHFMLEAHAPDLSINGLTILDSLSGNNNHRFDPGETVTVLINVSNPGDFPCVMTSGKLSTNSPYLIIASDDSVFLDIIYPGLSKNAAFTVTISDSVMLGWGTTLTFRVQSGVYHRLKNFQATIGIIVEDWETNSFSKFPWTYGGNMPWKITDIDPWEGIYCARSGLIDNSQNSILKIVYTSAVDDSLSFYRKTSSEPDYDFLYFYIDDILQGAWSGELPWDRLAFPVIAGTHEFKWIYSKDVFLSVGEDCAWLDFIEFPPPVLPNVSAGPDDTICAGETYQLQGFATNYDSLHWVTYGDGTFNYPSFIHAIYTPGTNDIINGTVNLKLIATGIGGGGSMSSMTLKIEPIPTAQLSGDDTICSGEGAHLTVLLTGNPPWKVVIVPLDTIEISTSPYNIQVHPVDSITYSLTAVSGPGNCIGNPSGTATIILNPVPGVSISVNGNDTICHWQSTTLHASGTGAISYTWMPGGYSGQDYTVNLATVGSPGTYWFYVTAANEFNCTAIDSVKITFKLCEGIENPEEGFTSEMYPNPNPGMFNLNIHSPVAETVKLRFFNPLNVISYESTWQLIPGNNRKHLDFSNLPEGVYLMVIERSSGKVMEKVVIQK